jgi:hypothetical protein
MSDADTDDGDELDDELDDDFDDEEPKAKGKKTPRPPGPHDQAIGNLVGQLLAAKGWEYPDFVNAVRPAHQGERWNKNRIGRLIRGERRISITELLDVIATIGISREEFFDRAGIIKLPDDLVSRIKVETTLSADGRRAMLAVLESQRS